MGKTCSSVGTRICVLIAIVSCIYTLYAGLDKEYTLTITERFLCAAAFILPLGCSSMMIAHRIEDPSKKQNVFRIFWTILFIYYLLQLGYMLFFAHEFSRQNSKLFDGNYWMNLQDQWETSSNLIPFQTIQLMLNAYRHQMIDLANINLLGNLVAFMPFAFFLPKLFPSMQSTFKFLCFMTLLIISVEITQLFTLSGTLDIDDFLLNMFGSIAFYFLLKIPLCQRFMKVQSQIN